MSQQKIDFNELCRDDQKRIEKALQTGLSRREALQLILATGVTAASADSIFATAQAAAAQKPKRGGSIRVAANAHGPDDTLDPIRATSSIDYSRMRACYNNLVRIGEDLSANPELATEFLPNADATEWTFKLRRDVTWHDGKPLTADDVVWSMNRHLGEKSTSVIKAIVASVKEWKKSGPHEVKAVMNTPNADLPVLVGLFQSKIVQAETQKFTGIGTGPFKLESFQPGIKSIHLRNEDYWDEGPYLDACEITAITNAVASANALVAGDIQVTANVDANAIRQIEAANGVEISSVPTGGYMGICCLKNTAPGDNADFVRGMQYIQDREKIKQRILKGHGTIGNDQPISAAYGSDHCNELPQRSYDPDKAKFHFNKAGASSAEIHVAPISVGVEDIVLLAQANCAKIGFDLQVKKVPSDGYWGAVWMREPINIVTWFMRPTANAMMAVAFAPGAAWNDTFWNNARMGELLKLSLKELDPARHHEMYCEMETLIHTESGIVIPAHPNILTGISSKVKGFPRVPLGVLGGSDWPLTVWLDS